MTEVTQTRTLAEIESDVHVARQQVLATAAAHQDAQQWLNGLRAELLVARVEADRDLPRATIFFRGKAHQIVCISRRAAKTIYTRQAGENPNSEQAWKESKYTSGDWHKHPRQKSYSFGSPMVLRIGEQA